MKIPLTLAIIPALVVTSGGDRYAIPQVSLLELVRLGRRRRAEGHRADPGRAGLPFARTIAAAGVSEPRAKSRSGKCGRAGLGESAVNIVVLQADERQFGLVVDEINDTEEIVVKPLGKQLKGIKTFAGSTIMGDGRVALILDVLGVAQASNVVAENRERSMADKEARVAAASDGKQTMLLFQCGLHGRMAMDLSLVARLEEFKPENLEKTGDRQVVQYRSQIMPLIRVSDFMGTGHDEKSSGNSDGSEAIQVVVYSEQGRSVGLVVDRIIDIVEETIVLQQPSPRAGVLGSAVIQQRVTDLLDVHGLVRAANPTFFESQIAAQER